MSIQIGTANNVKLQYLDLLTSVVAVGTSALRGQEDSTQRDRAEGDAAPAEAALRSELATALQT